MTELNNITSAALLESLKDTDDKPAWDQFYEFYAPLIIAFCRNQGCTQDMANDILQETMVNLMKLLPDFEYNPAKGRFRSFLLTVVSRRIKDAFNRQRWYLSLSTTSKINWVEQLEDPREGKSTYDWDQIWYSNLFQYALKMVEKKISSLTYRSFKLYVLERKNAEDVSKILSITKNTVFQHKNRVLKLLQQELKRLKKEFGE